MGNFGDYQNEIYLGGLSGRQPPYPMRFWALGDLYAHGLALGGVDGIVHVLRCLLAEADLYMAVDGHPRLSDLRPELLLRLR